MKIQDNIQIANLFIDSGERADLKDIINILREGNNTLIDKLGTTEDINQTLNRDEDIKNVYKPKKIHKLFSLEQCFF